MKNTLLFIFAFSAFLQAQVYPSLERACKRDFNLDSLYLENAKLVNNSCFVKNLGVHPSTVKGIVYGLELEERLGYEGYAHYLSKLLPFRVLDTNKLKSKNILDSELKNLLVFAQDELDVYSFKFDDKYIEKLKEYTFSFSKKNAKKRLSRFFLDQEHLVEKLIEQGLYNENNKALINVYKRDTERLITELVSLLFSNGDEDVTVYSLLDNDNENVAETQYVLVGNGYVFLIETYYIL